jgi:hypothetical protein
MNGIAANIMTGYSIFVLPIASYTHISCELKTSYLPCSSFCAKKKSQLP